jgi:hypothetical protein
MLQALALVLEASVSVSMDDIAAAYVAAHPGPTKTLVCIMLCTTLWLCCWQHDFQAAAQTLEAIRRVGVKERRPGDSRVKWHVREDLAGLLNGEVVDFDAIASAARTGPAKAADSAPPGMCRVWALRWASMHHVLFVWTMYLLCMPWDRQ